MPLFLWVEACYTAVYLQNRSPHKAVGSMTPEEASSWKKPEVGHFRILGASLIHMSLLRRGQSWSPRQREGSLLDIVSLQRLFVYTFLP
jgi:hypothetical protein